jgi:hypothetical protein
MTTETDVTAKAGVGVSASYTDAMKTAAALRFEAEINVTIRKNYSDDYAGLNADVKHIISEIVSSQIAKEAIAYDMSGYTNLREAENKINMLDVSVKINKSLLIDKERQRFINGA